MKQDSKKLIYLVVITFMYGSFFSYILKNPIGFVFGAAASLLQYTVEDAINKVKVNK